MSTIDKGHPSAGLTLSRKRPEIRAWGKSALGWALQLLALVGLASLSTLHAQIKGSNDSGLKPAEASINYKICPADILEVTVFQEADLKSMLRVSNEGSITLPLIGAVSVKGLTSQEAAQAIQLGLAKGYLINPQVNVTVMEFSKRRFTVLGQVQKPGSYDMPDQEDVTLLQAIGMAGGYARVSGCSKVTISLKLDGAQKGYHFNSKKMA